MLCDEVKVRKLTLLEWSEMQGKDMYTETTTVIINWKT